MSRYILHVVLLGGLLVAGLGPAQAQGPTPRFAAGDVLVRFRPGLSPEAAMDLVARAHGHAMEHFPRLGIWRMRVEPGQEQAVARALGALPQVAYAEPNYLVGAMAGPPNDPYYGLQWGLERIQAPPAWEITRGDPAAPIAIIDTGIDLSHPDLAAKLWSNPGEVPGNGQDDDGNGYVDDVHGYDFVSGQGAPQDDHGHGTHVSGIAAAATDNGLGVAGMAPTSPLMALKVLNSGGDGTYLDVARAMDYARAEGARVINLSLGGTEEDNTMYEAVQRATAAGVLVVAAAGNYGNQGNPKVYPGAYDETLAVAATDSADQAASFSERHPYVDLAAPGVSILSTARGGGYSYLSGTSMATPYVAGLTALLWAADPALTAETVTARLMESAVDLGAPGKDDTFGWGRINAWAALCTLTTPLSASPGSLSFMADTQGLTVPVDRTVQVVNRGCAPVTWNAAVSPASATWVHLTSTDGTLGQGSSTTLQVEVDPTALAEAYGDYTAQLHLVAQGRTGAATVELRLHYVPRIYQQTLLLILKNAPLAALGP